MLSINPIGVLSKILDCVRVKAAPLQETGGGEQSGHRHAERKRRVTAVFLPK